MGKLQDADFKTSAELATAGGTDANLTNANKIYISSLSKRLDTAISDGSISGSLAWQAKSASYTLTASDQSVGFTTGASNLNATLPTAVGISGKIYTIKKVDSGSGTVSVLTTSSQTINGYASGVFKVNLENEYVTVQSDGANWHLIGHSFVVATKATVSSTFTTSASGAIVFDSVSYDPYGGYNSSNGHYTAPFTGVYLFAITAQASSGGQTAIQAQNVTLSDSIYVAQPTSTTALVSAGSQLVNASAGDTMYFSSDSASVVLNSITAMTITYLGF